MRRRGWPLRNEEEGMAKQKMRRREMRMIRRRGLRRRKSLWIILRRSLRRSSFFAGLTQALRNGCVN